MKKVVRALLLLLAATAAFSQTTPPQPSAKPDGPIQDNSFLLEEAYNQEDGVIQHISSFQRLFDSKEWVYTFTQEFPVPIQKHQLSYTVPVVSLPEGIGTGVGDVMINYRFQAIGTGETRLAFSPRASLILPTGDYRKGRGAGAVGVQFNLPFSVVLTDKIVTHWNAGGTIIPGAKNELGEKSRVTGYNLGASLIYQFNNRFNAMFETVWTGDESVIGRKETQRYHELFLNPGIRWAHNFDSGLQIVPGVSVPIGVGPSSGEKGLLFYVSFEHPWKALFGRR